MARKKKSRLGKWRKERREAPRFFQKGTQQPRAVDPRLWKVHRCPRPGHFRVPYGEWLGDPLGFLFPEPAETLEQRKRDAEQELDFLATALTASLSRLLRLLVNREGQLAGRQPSQLERHPDYQGGYWRGISRLEARIKPQAEMLRTIYGCTLAQLVSELIEAEVERLGLAEVITANAQRKWQARVRRIFREEIK